jgi:hypothetical protein
MNHVDRFVSNDELTGIISPDAIAKAGTYIVTLKCAGESFPESHQAISWRALSHSEARYREHGLRL